MLQGVFMGTYGPAIDAQCRIVLPSQWRNAEGSEMVMLPAPGRAMNLFPAAAFMEFIAVVRKRAIADTKIQAALAYLGSFSRECRCDKQGRMALDRQMLNSIGVTDKVMLIGAFTHIRLTAPENWQPAGGEDVLSNYLNEIGKVGDGGTLLESLLSGAVNGRNK